MKSGGMFRLAKVNSDAERMISSTLDVTGLPSVFAVVNGKINDRYVYMYICMYVLCCMYVCMYVCM